MQKAFGAPSINATEIEAFCQREQITATAFLEKFVRQIVTGYVEGRFTWLSCDTAMNGLSGLMTQYKIFPDYPWGVFLAFDAGENHPNTTDLTPDEVTRPLIDKLIAENHAA